MLRVIPTSLKMQALLASTKVKTQDQSSLLSDGKRPPGYAGVLRRGVELGPCREDGMAGVAPVVSQ